MGAILGENMTGPLRIGVRFRYWTTQRTTSAKRAEETSPVTAPKTMLKIIFLGSSLYPDEDGAADDGLEGEGGSEETCLLNLPWHCTVLWCKLNKKRRKSGWNANNSLAREERVCLFLNMKAQHKTNKATTRNQSQKLQNEAWITHMLKTPITSNTWKQDQEETFILDAKMGFKKKVASISIRHKHLPQPFKPKIFTRKPSQKSKQTCYHRIVLLFSNESHLFPLPVTTHKFSTFTRIRTRIWTSKRRKKTKTKTKTHYSEVPAGTNKPNQKQTRPRNKLQSFSLETKQKVTKLNRNWRGMDMW